MSEPIELPAGDGQVVYDGYRKRALAAGVGEMPEWGELPPDLQAACDGAAEDLRAYLERVPG